ncbi:MAG: hypothetical protein ACLQAT_09970 [Candidatus Binataceae bacterium]
MERVKVLAGLVLLSIVAASRAQTGSSRDIAAIINGIICDPSRATLVAEETNENRIDNFNNLRRVKLYRTIAGHYFVELLDTTSICTCSPMTTRLGSMKL